MTDVERIPSNYPRVTPYLCISGAAEAIDYYQNVFGARERGRMDSPDGKVGHAELEIGDALIMLSDEFPDMEWRSPRSIGGSPVMLHVYVEDVDATVQKAVEAGATSRRPVDNQFYGDRSGVIEDPWGHVWNVATHVEDVPEDEMKRRAQEAMASMAQ